MRSWLRCRRRVLLSARPLKLVLVGDSNVGKSSILMRYCKDDFRNNIHPSIGMDFKVSMCTLSDKGTTVKVADVGHGWPGTVPNHNTTILPWSGWNFCGVRHDRRRISAKH